MDVEALYAGDVFSGYGVEVALPDADAFLKVKETLTRVGIATNPGVLDQPCFILHKKGRYAIVHYLELRTMDREFDEIDDDLYEYMDAVRNTVATLLDQWNLVEIIDEPPVVKAPVSDLKIVPHKMKGQWKLNPLYEIGRRR